jgi:glutaconate CoA-transferase subunit B
VNGHLLDLLAFLVRAAREFHHAGWVFTGFHWPVLAGEVAARLDNRTPGTPSFRQLFEAGFATEGPADHLPTSTTDFAAFGSAVTWRGSTGEVLGSLVSRTDLVVLDAANVDLMGRLNSTAVGDYRAPHVRLPGGGGAPDAAVGARDLLLLYGGADPARIVARVENVTAAPGQDTVVRLLTRWGTVRLGPAPRLLTAARDTAVLAARLRTLGIDTADALMEKPPSDRELSVAAAVLAEAAERGYLMAREAVHA